MIWTKLKGYAGVIAGASWVDPFRVFGWGGDSGGGDYSSPDDFTATAKGKNQAHLTGIVPTVTNASQFRYVRAYNADHTLHSEYWPSKKNSFIWNATTSYLSVGGADWGSAAYLVIVLRARHRAYAVLEDAYQNYIINPLNAWRQDPILVEVTNATDGAEVFFYVDFETYKYGGFQLNLDCDAGTVTATLGGTYRNDGTARESCAYQDILGLVGAVPLVSAAAPAESMWIFTTPQSFKYVRVGITYTTGGNTGDATVLFGGTY